MAFRRLKHQVLALLQAQDFDASLAAIEKMPARQVVNPLFALLYDGHALVRWRAVTAMGSVVSHLGDQDPEAARVIMRRLMWNLNDESGGIGWGSPEAMGEIMACSRILAAEYAAILVSYIDPAGNYLEHEGLQQGVLWAIGRVGRSYPKRVSASAPLLPLYLNSVSDAVRGLAVWSAGPVLTDPLKSFLEPLCIDRATFSLYWKDRFQEYTIAETAKAVLRGKVF
jgi:hypothetical protein